MSQPVEGSTKFCSNAYVKDSFVSHYDNLQIWLLQKSFRKFYDPFLTPLCYDLQTYSFSEVRF